MMCVEEGNGGGFHDENARKLRALAAHIATRSWINAGQHFYKNVQEKCFALQRETKTQKVQSILPEAKYNSLTFLC